MKKSIIYGTIALLSVSVFFLGCPTEADDGGIGYTAESSEGRLTPAKAAQDLKDLIPGATVNGTTVTLPGSSTIAVGDTIPVAAGVTLVAPSLTNNGTISVAGDLVVSGTVVNGGTIQLESGSVYTLDAGATGSNSGTVTVKAGAVIRNGAGVSITGSGTNVVEAGGTVYFNGDTIPFIGGPSAQFNLTSGTFTYDNNGYVLNGAATLTNASGGEVYLDPDALTINENSVLTIAANAQLRMSNCTSTSTLPILGGTVSTGAAPRIIWNATGSSRFSGSSTYYYFYPNGYSSIAGGGLPTPAPATYVWATNAASTGAAGWVAIP